MYDSTCDFIVDPTIIKSTRRNSAFAASDDKTEDWTLDDEKRNIERFSVRSRLRHWADAAKRRRVVCYFYYLPPQPETLGLLKLVLSVSTKTLSGSSSCATYRDSPGLEFSPYFQRGVQ